MICVTPALIERHLKPKKKKKKRQQIKIDPACLHWTPLILEKKHFR